MNPIVYTIPFADDSFRLLEIFKDEPHVFFLDSSLSQTADGRFSYFGFAPLQTVKAKNFDQLRKAFKPYIGTAGGRAVGYIGYEGEAWFGFYDGVLCLDHQRQTLTISSTGLPYHNNRQQRQAVRHRIDYVLYKLQNHLSQKEKLKPFKGKLKIRSNTTPAQFKAAVKKALQHIYEGDIYQINLAHRLEAEIKNWQQYTHPAHIYRHLRELSPSAFSAYLDDGHRIILSSSPERFLKLMQGVAQVRPMKGTRPRGQNPLQDERNRRELVDSAKEKAELLMVTDLERNDLGRVCCYGSVHVKDMRTIEEYSTVFQATSTVEGRLHEKFDQFDLLKATFPSGSVTGCPKIEAMKIIRSLEKSPRHLYTGALGYIGFNGDMDFNVLIRTLFLEKDRISFYVGSGIVADSNPHQEYEETLVKAQAMTQALREIFR